MLLLVEIRKQTDGNQHGLCQPVARFSTRQQFWRRKSSWLRAVTEWVISKFKAHQHQKGHTVPKQYNDCNVNSSRYSLSTALCESIRYQAKSEQNVRQDLIPSVRHVEADLCTPDQKSQPASHSPEETVFFRDGLDNVYLAKIWF